jgi:hypothetical protein
MQVEMKVVDMVEDVIIFIVALLSMGVAYWQVRHVRQVDHVFWADNIRFYVDLIVRVQEHMEHITSMSSEDNPEFQVLQDQIVERCRLDIKRYEAQITRSRNNIPRRLWVKYGVQVSSNVK